MYTIDTVNIILGFWLKPMIILFVMLSIANSSFGYSASRSHWFLSCALVLSVLILAAMLWLPQYRIDVIPHSLAPLTHVPVLHQSMMFYAVVASYIFVIFWIISFQFIALFEVYRLTERAADTDVSSALNHLRMECPQLAKHAPVIVKESTEIQSPVMWGILSPVILMPTGYREWDADRVKRVLAHELAHVKRGDWVVKFVCKVCCAVFWMVPLVWYVAKRIEWYAELASDDMVVSNLDCRTEYAEDLLALASERKPSDWFMSFIRSSELFERIRYVLDGRNQREALGVKGKFCFGISCILLALPLAVIKASPKPLHIDSITDFPVYIPERNMENNTHEDALEYAYYLPRINYPSSQQPAKPRFQEDMIVTSLLTPVQASTAKYGGEPTASPGVQLTRIAMPTVDISGLLPERMVTPTYPRKAIDREVEGKVIVQFDIDEQGNIVKPRIIVSQPKKVFDRAVLRALKQSKYRPMEIEGQPIKVKNVSETFNFKLFESTTDKPAAIMRPNNLRTARFNATRSNF